MAWSKEAKIRAGLRSRPQPQTPIATDMFIPNHSGVSRHKELDNFVRTDATSSTTFAVPYHSDTTAVKIFPSDVTITDGDDINAGDVTVTGGFYGDGSNITGIEGTQIKSTGESGGTKFLREDGDDTCSWQTVSAGLWETSGGHVSLISSDDILMNTTEKIQFRDTAIFIYSNADGELTIEADTKVTIGVAGDITLGDSTERDLQPQTNKKINLGTTSLRFNDLFADGDIVFGDLPTVDPGVAGQIWSDSGTLKVSSG